MQPGERIRLINKCSKLLAQNPDWAEIDFILDQFGFPTTDDWEPYPDEVLSTSKFRYVREMIKGHWIPSHQLTQLESYLSSDERLDNPSDNPWQPDAFRVFLTHVSREKAMTTRVKGSLAPYGFDAFVAHQDIEPGVEWVRNIVAALRSCDALVALLHEGFKESNWCDQEVGFVYGRGQPVVPISVDFVPYGFLGSVQAVKAKNLQASDIAKEVVDVLARDKKTAEQVLEVLIRTFESSESFNQSNLLVQRIGQHASLVSSEQLKRMQRAAQENYQVSEAFEVPGILARLKTAIAARTD